MVTPTAAEIRALLEACGWSAYEAAQRVGITASAMQQATRGETTLRGGLWSLLQIHASQAARDALPPPALP
jgi:transcriptional regulator with XRE-family HTH domain